MTKPRSDQAGDSYSRTVELLRQPATHADRPAQVEVIETHISCVFLTDRAAYKLKKPVKYDFLDFSTPEARRRACEDEVRLNRRLAGETYLGVLPITENEHGLLALDGEGDPIDWVVSMRRLPIDYTLEALLEAGTLEQQHIERLVRRLADFYRDAAPLAIEPEAYRRMILDHVEGNRAELLAPAHELLALEIKRVHGAQLLFLELEAELIRSRVTDGRVIEGHGDLRPEHIVLEPEVVVFDCIEFSRAFRELDVADELCFLSMECDRLRAGEVGERVLTDCLRAIDDRPSERLLAFYKSYRACVRGKVAALRRDQMAKAKSEEVFDEALADLHLADRYALLVARPPVIVIGGLMGTGKSTLAAALAPRIGADWLQTDRIRRALLGASGKPAGYGEGIYDPQQRGRIYDELFSQAEKLAAHRVPVVLDATFLKRDLLARAQSIAQAHHAPLLFVYCECPADVARERIARRAAAGKDPSEARPDLYEQQEQSAEALPPDVLRIDVDTTAAIEAQVDCVLSALREMCVPTAHPA